jgi:hypothetical protein
MGRESCLAFESPAEVTAPQYGRPPTRERVQSEGDVIQQPLTTHARFCVQQRLGGAAQRGRSLSGGAATSNAANFFLSRVRGAGRRQRMRRTQQAPMPIHDIWEGQVVELLKFVTRYPVRRVGCNYGRSGSAYSNMLRIDRWLFWNSGRTLDHSSFCRDLPVFSLRW